MSESNNLQSLQYSNESSKPTLCVLDQLLIPQTKTYIPIQSVNDAWDVIRKMQIRGAPLIAIVACLGLAVDLSSNPTTLEELEKCKEKEDVKKLIGTKVEYLRTSRPTAVNLFNALEELTKAIQKVEQKEDVIDTVIGHAEMMLKRDVSDNEAIGKHGADALLDGREDGKGVRMMTICNTGSLATAGFGTALGVARELQRRGKLDGITALETRPYNQGSRLTAFEIMEEKMPNGSLICDGMAASFMKNKGCDAVIVGADRVCANGDTANKIGTYNLSIIAEAHNVPFYVASPFTTLDVNLEHGDKIEIEERPAKELVDTSRAPKDMPCWNPAFDVTPARLIKGIITERGVIQNEGGVIDVVTFVKEHTDKSSSTSEEEEGHVDKKMKIAD